MLLSFLNKTKEIMLVSAKMQVALCNIIFNVSGNEKLIGNKNYWIERVLLEFKKSHIGYFQQAKAMLDCDYKFLGCSNPTVFSNCSWFREKSKHLKNIILRVKKFWILTNFIDRIVYIPRISRSFDYCERFTWWSLWIHSRFIIIHKKSFDCLI